MPMSNPRRNVGEESIRVQEFTGGFRPREMLGDYDVNANENSDGLSHVSQYGAASEETMEQMDREKRRKKALEEMKGEMPHISIKPEKIADTLSSTPMKVGEDGFKETGMGIDMDSTGIGISQGRQAGSIRREGPGMIFGRSEDAFEDAWTLMKDDDDIPTPDEIRQDLEDFMAERLQDDYFEMDPEQRKTSNQFMLTDIAMTPTGQPFIEQASGNARGNINPKNEKIHREGIVHAAEHGLGGYHKDDFKWFVPTPIGVAPDWNKDLPKSADPVLLSDIVKAKRKKRGRKYEEDEESEEEEAKAKKKGKRERRRKMKQGKKEASRQPYSKTKRRAASAEQNLQRYTKRQAFAPRRMFSGNPRAKDLPLRLRDPVAYQRKLAAEKFRREMGALPRGLSAHADTRGITGERVQTIGTGTKLPSSPAGSKGTKFVRPKTAESEGVLLHDALGGDPLSKSSLLSRGIKISGFKMNELQSLKRDLKKLLAAVEKLTKATPELGAEAKRGNQASEDKNSAPTGATENLKGWKFEDTSLLPVAGAGAGKR